jgi:hypothetical protein
MGRRSTTFHEKDEPKKDLLAAAPSEDKNLQVKRYRKETLVYGI